MKPRIHVPFDNWAMPVDVQVSQLVRVGDLAWSCGQCPLDPDGRVLSPGDLTAQAEIVCDYVETMLPRADLSNAAVAVLVAYHVARKPSDTAELMAVLRRRFGPLPLIVPVTIPHFYYDGMMLEVDVYASAVAHRIPSPDGAGEGVDGGDLCWRLASLPFDRLEGISDRDTGPQPILSTSVVMPSGASAEPGSVGTSLPHSNAVLRAARPMEVAHVFSTLTNERVERSSNHDVQTTPFAPDVQISRGQEFCWITGSCPDASLTLTKQTAVIMEKIDAALHSHDLSFEHVVKLNAHYVGTPSPEDLHENLAIRHRYYGTPGPASTGLPVEALYHPDARIVVDVLAVA